MNKINYILSLVFLTNMQLFAQNNWANKIESNSPIMQNDVCLISLETQLRLDGIQEIGI